MSLSVIHFSDIHIKGADDVILKRIDELKSASVSSLPNNGDVVIAISGDIAFSGTEQQYSLAKGLIDSISCYIAEQKTSKVYVVCVPGNHDCDFSEESSIRTVLIDSARSSTIDLDYYNNVTKVQIEYRRFAENYGINSDNVLPRIEISSGESSILFLLANTAWMSVLKETPGKIIMPSHLYESISPEVYNAVFYIFHHPINWLDPDLKKSFVDHVRQNADFVLIGHEHARDSYEKFGNSFSVYCSHGKELQDSNSGDSAFTVINFDNAFQNYDIVDYKWDGKKYNRCPEVNTNQYHKNIASKKRVYTPNEETLKHASDIGVVINHFAKENISLPDLFIWPDLSKSDYYNEKNGSIIIREKTIEELYKNSLTVLVGASGSGKTAIAKKQFLFEETRDSCCLLLHGSKFTSSDESQIKGVIESSYSEQYSKDYLEEFRQLPKEQRSVIIDDFDLVRNVKNRRCAVLDYLCGFFGRVTILLSSSIELTTILSSNALGSMGHVIYYEILPLGNKKRKEMISKWYHLNENSLTEEEIGDRVDNAIEKINVFLGNGNGFVPAVPIFVLGALQNIDAVQKTFTGSKYGYLYESLIISSLSKISSNYLSAGSYEIDVGILSKLAFNMLLEKRTSFSTEQIEEVVSDIGDKHLLHLSSNEFLQRMVTAKIIYIDSSCGNTFRFMYPYIYYYFCGRYIAYHIGEPAVQREVEYMSAKLYNEIYGNIIIFVCHFANNSDIIDDVLLNAYDTLYDYEAFDFSKGNPIFEEIKDAVEALIPKTVASSDADVSTNKETRLAKMDEVGVNDGSVIRGEDTIDDEISEKEKDLAAVVAAFKTIEVLGEILQNYPIGIDGPKKIEIIDEIHKLGMRSVQAVINTMGYLEKDLVEYVYERASREKKRINKDEVIRATRRFINLLVSGMARGMVHQVAASLNSEYLLPAAKKTFEDDISISSKLVLLDLKLNCLNHCNFSEIQNLKKEFDTHNEKFASRIVDSIVGYYLNYNRCDHVLRAKLCTLCGLSQQQALIATQRNLLN